MWSKSIEILNPYEATKTAVKQESVQHEAVNESLHSLVLSYIRKMIR